MRELALAYDGTLSLRAGLSYRNFFNYLHGRPIDASLEYWRGYLNGVEPCLFPRLVDDAQSPSRFFKSVSLNLDLPSHALLDFCKEHGVSLFHIFQTAWALVLRTYLNSDDVCFGFVTSGRDTPINGIGQAVGAFISMLVCRASIDTTTSLLSFMKNIQAAAIESLEHQHCPLGEIQHALKLSGQSLFNTAIAFQKVWTCEGNESDASITVQRLGEHDATEVISIPFSCKVSR
jgi:hypothetical protein